ncbi:MAG TPA: hypothetical protein VFQ65_08475, partial [Kofleriaceae bacterium]|nr:hypothetical protein [Kofleriaceae bacterium]
MTEYPAAVARMFERNVEAVAATLPEPQTTTPARARRVIELLVETLAGYAYGSVVGQLSRSVSSWFGAEYSLAVRAAPVPKRRRVRNENHDVRIARALAHAPLDLGHEFRVALQTRLGITARDVADLVFGLDAILPAGQTRMAGAMFSELNRDSVFDDRLALEIATGWEHASAAIERRPYATLQISPRARELWQIWSRLAGA